MDPDAAETTSMGQKGQVVIPKAVRDRLGLGPHTKFIVYSSGDMIVMKKITVPDVRKELEEVFKAIDRKNLGLSEEDVDKEIQAMRKERRNQAKE